MVRRKPLILKNPNTMAKKKYLAVINPLGDITFGLLNWDKKKTFTTRKQAVNWARNN